MRWMYSSMACAATALSTDSAVLVALFKQADRGFAFVKVKILDLDAAPGRQADARVNIELEDGAAAVVKDGFAGRQAHQLARSRDRQRLGFVASVGGFAGDELRIGGIGHGDWQAQLGRRRAGTCRSWRAN